MPKSRKSADGPAAEEWIGQVEAEMRKPKELISIRLDADLVAYFKGTGARWQTRVNAILRAYKQQVGK